MEYCPANAVKLGQKIGSKTPIVQPETILPDDHEWGEDKWNPNYRDSKVNVVPTGTAPCKINCPAHIAVQGYIKLAALGKYHDALELIRKENPLPGCLRTHLQPPLRVRMHPRRHRPAHRHR